MYFERLSKKPVKEKIDNGTFLVGVQVNEEGEEQVVRFPSSALGDFKGDIPHFIVADGAVCAVFEEEE